MEKKIKILKEVEVYSTHDSSSNKIKTLSPEECVSYNREKLRNGILWLEIYIEEDTVAYIKHEEDTFFKFKKVELADEKALGFSYTQKTNPPLELQQLFFPEGYLNVHETKDAIGKIELKNVINSEENESLSLTLEYLHEQIEVETKFYSKDETFYITNNISAFIEVDNLKGKKGLLLEKTNVSNTYDQLMNTIAGVIAIATVLGIFLFFLSEGFIVISGLMIIAGLAVGFVAVFMMQAIIHILKTAFDTIWKRL